MKKNMIKTNSMQRGFAMLEVMLAVLIIALASFGIYKLYSSSSSRGSNSSTEEVVSQVAAAVTRYSNIYMAQPTLANLVNTGYLSGDLVSGTNVKSSYGNIAYATVSSGANNAFTLTIKQVPSGSQYDLAKSFVGMASVKIGSTAFDGTAPTSPPTAAADITLTFPKA